MAIRVRRSFGRLADIPLVTRDTMQDVGEIVRLRILDRTAQGFDVDGLPFVPYSPGYAAAKAAERFGLLGGTLHVDLTLSGRMLDEMGVQNVTERTVTLGWTR